MHDVVQMNPRFCGPPGMANGGYVAGRLAQQLGPGPAEITLRSPIPLDRTLTVEASGTNVRLMDGDTVLADGRTVPSFEEKEPELRQQVAREIVNGLVAQVQGGAQVERFNLDGSPRPATPAPAPQPAAPQQ